MIDAGVSIRGQILFRTDQNTLRYILQWCLVRVNDKEKSWRIIKDVFPNELEAIAYGKNLILKHLTEQGLGDAVDEVEWIKGDETYYCPACLSRLAHEAKEKRVAIPQDLLVLRCEQGHTIPNIPADAFMTAP
jgi:hypothetical protein